MGVPLFNAQVGKREELAPFLSALPCSRCRPVDGHRCAWDGRFISSPLCRDFGSPSGMTAMLLRRHHPQCVIVGLRRAATGRAVARLPAS